MRKLPIAVISAFLLMFISNMVAAADYKIGVVSPRGPLQSLARWTELANYLSQESGKKVEIVPLIPKDILTSAQLGNIDFVFSHSLHTVYVKEKLKGKVLATVKTKQGSHFAGIILARRGSGINKSEDLVGKNVISLNSANAAGAYLFQAYHLMKKGIYPKKDFNSLKEGHTQDELVFAVKEGMADAAFIRTGLLGEMAREGKIRMNEFVVVDRTISSDFPLSRTTELFPEWCLTALSKVPDEFSQSIKNALLNMDPSSPAAMQGHILGFVEPVSLETTRIALQELKIAPFDF